LNLMINHIKYKKAVDRSQFKLIEFIRNIFSNLIILPLVTNFFISNTVGRRLN